MNAAIILTVIVLTAPDGRPIWVETQHIQTIREDHSGCPTGSGAIIRFDSGSTLCVQETPAQISEKARAE